MFSASSLSSQVIELASVSAVATGGMRPKKGPRRSAAKSERIPPSMPVAVGPGATALVRIPCGE